MPECPFVSNRTLRSQRTQPPPPPSTSTSSLNFSSKTSKKNQYKNRPVTIAGNFIKNVGFLQGPPTKIGSEFFFFDPLYPPLFSEGVYGVSLMEFLSNKSTVVEEKEQKQDIAPEIKPQISTKSKLKAPPLPPLNSANVVETKTASNKIVINKIKKDDKPKSEEPTGWQAVMAEMAKRANKRSGAAPAPVEPKIAPKEVPKKKEETKKKKKKTVFKDVVEELNYKMAVKRGEIIEADEDDEEEEAKPQPVKEVKSAKPDIASMLSKRLTLAAPPSNSNATNVVSTQSKDSNKSDIAVPLKKQKPAPPPLPKLWPPSPFTEEYPKKPNVIAATKVPEVQEVPTEKKPTTPVIIKPQEPPKWKILPEGYYIGINPNNDIKHYDIKSQGVMTQESKEAIIADYFKPQDESDEEENDEIEPEIPIVYHRLPKEKNIDKKVKKLAIADLPLPTGFYAAVDRLKKSSDKRKEFLEKEKSMELRNYGDNLEQEISSPQKPRKPTKPRQFSFSTDKHFEEKVLSFRKNITNNESDESKYSTFDRLNQISRIEHQVTNEKNASNAFWLNSLRSFESNKNISKEPLISKTNEDLFNETLNQIVSSPKSKLEKTFSDNMFSPSNSQVNIYLASTPKSVTKPIAPRLRSDEIVKRKQQERESKEKEKIEQQRHEKMIKNLKTKEYLENMSQASSTTKRNREIERMIQKYKGNKKLGVDIQKLSEEALREYYRSQNSEFTTSEYPQSQGFAFTPQNSSPRNPKYQWYQNTQLEELEDYPPSNLNYFHPNYPTYQQQSLHYQIESTPSKPMVYDDLIYDDYRD